MVVVFLLLFAAVCGLLLVVAVSSWLLLLLVVTVVGYCRCCCSWWWCCCAGTYCMLLFAFVCCRWLFSVVGHCWLISLVWLLLKNVIVVLSVVFLWLLPVVVVGRYCWFLLRESLSEICYSPHPPGHPPHLSIALARGLTLLPSPERHFYSTAGSSTDTNIWLAQGNGAGFTDAWSPPKKSLEPSNGLPKQNKKLRKLYRSKHEYRPATDPKTMPHAERDRGKQPTTSLAHITGPLLPGHSSPPVCADRARLKTIDSACVVHRRVLPPPLPPPYRTQRQRRTPFLGRASLADFFFSNFKARVVSVEVAGSWVKLRYVSFPCVLLFHFSTLGEKRKRRRKKSINRSIEADFLLMCLLFVQCQFQNGQFVECWHAYCKKAGLNILWPRWWLIWSPAKSSVAVDGAARELRKRAMDQTATARGRYLHIPKLILIFIYVGFAINNLNPCHKVRTSQYKHITEHRGMLEKQRGWA